MSSVKVQRIGRAGPQGHRPVRTTALFLSAALLSTGVALSVLPSVTATWLRGVHTTRVFHSWQTAWDYFDAGQPTAAEYRHMLHVCEAQGGTYITKAGTGSIGGDGGGYTTVTLDYSCWR
ncbi:MAG TPA: hypothetical protein VJT31_11060 [Rugosimonospora sp.]|nr:hypothetical protein [Rugosimonospora sp.]